MSILLTLTSMLGKPIAEGLIDKLRNQKDGSQKLEDAANAMATGLTAIEALKKTFGKDFLSALNGVLGNSGQLKFSYEAGTQSYIRVDDDKAMPIQVLRDELNINLDRLSVLDADGADIRNLFQGLVSVWGNRCLQFFGEKHKDDIDSTLVTINRLLKGEAPNYRQIYELLSSTTLGGIGTIMLIAGVLMATGTGVGVATAFSIFVFGIPWLAVGALVLPGALLLILAARKPSPSDVLSLSVAIAYQLIKRLSNNK